MSPLREELRRLIAAEGPISLERYMRLALSHPRYGYYATRDPFGAAGDFVTAPEISQMFGELIGLWAAEMWQLTGASSPMRLVELGPGRGTLMADALRAIMSIPASVGVEAVHLVETSPRLVEVQRATLGGRNAPVFWHDCVERVPQGCAIVIANEFFDALPVQHFVRMPEGWCERLVGLDADGQLAFGISPHATAEITVDAPTSSIIELSATARQVTAALARRIGKDGGALLIIDYGHTETTLGETLQAVRAHRFVDPLEAPGELDLTAHVDFAALAREAERGGARIHGPVPQADFLLSLGIAERAQRLSRSASAKQAAAVESALARLTDCVTPTSMGRLFKAMAVTSKAMHSIPGFA
jgi:NADH dehydrogenase [ubiquinone] 1 alpha subcomplex assembly factor 7